MNKGDRIAKISLKTQRVFIFCGIFELFFFFLVGGTFILAACQNGQIYAQFDENMLRKLPLYATFPP